MTSYTLSLWQNAHGVKATNKIRGQRPYVQRIMRNIYPCSHSADTVRAWADVGRRVCVYFVYDGVSSGATTYILYGGRSSVNDTIERKYN